MFLPLPPLPPLLSTTDGVARCCLYCIWLLLGFSRAVAQTSQQPVAVSIDPTLVPPLDNASLTWTTTEALLFSSIDQPTYALTLWGPVVVPPWKAFVSASIPCDRISEKVFFTDDGLNFSSAVHYDPKHSIRDEAPLLTTAKGVYTELACLTACIQSKNFTCRSFDYFWKDGGRCGLYNFKGQVSNIDKPYYSTTNDGSDHYDLEVDGNCSQNGVPYRSHNFATIAWQAFAIGWFELAAFEFDKAIRTGEQPLTAYLGRTLCNDDFGFSAVNGSYKEDIFKTVNSTDLTHRLSKQENLYFRALARLLNANNLTQGSAQFAATIDEVAAASVDTTVVDLSQYALGLTLRGVALLNVNLSLGINALVRRVQSQDMTAMAFVTKRFDPYNNGPEVFPHFDSAVQAATAFYLTYVSQKGVLSADLFRSSINVLEAYAKWAIAAPMARAFSNPRWLASLVTENLLVESSGTYYVKDIGIFFTSRDEQVILYERAHFQYLQGGSFSAASELATFIQDDFLTSNSSFERAIVYRILATAYYSSSESIYDSYAANVTFSRIAATEKADDDLMKWSVGYHQLAQYLQNTSSADGATTSAAYRVYEQLLNGFINATTPQGVYSTALSMLLFIAKSRERESNGNMQEALEAGRKGSELQAMLANVTLAQGTRYIRQLLPIGHVYYGELLKRAFDSQSVANKTGLVDARETALLSAALWLPRNTSTSIFGLSKLYASAERYRPEIALDYLHTLTNAWNSSGNTDKSGGFPGYYAAVALERQLANPDPGPCAGTFNVTVGCFGFWILIAIAIAAVVIIGVTVLVLRCRRRIRRPVKDKENESDFVFKGPQDFLSPDTNTLSSLYRYGNVGSARSLDSSTHELADAYNQEGNGYYKPSGSAIIPTDAPDTAATPSAEYSNAAFAPTTLERSKYDRVKRRDAPQADVPDVYFASPAGSATTLERGFNVPKDFE